MVVVAIMSPVIGSIKLTVTPSKPGSPGSNTPSPSASTHSCPVRFAESSDGSDGSPPLLHSVILSTPPLSQSAVAKAFVGSSANKAQMSTPSDIAALQSSAGLLGSAPLLHSVRLSIPPPSQSAVANGWFGLLIIIAQISTLAAIAIEQSSDGSPVGSPPKLHSVKLSIPPPSQSSEARGWVASPLIIAHTSRPAAITEVHSSDASKGSPPFAHSVALSTPPLSQSKVAKALVGLAAMIAQTSKPASSAAVHSSLGFDGSVPA